jgi:hypothetical protein
VWSRVSNPLHPCLRGCARTLRTGTPIDDSRSRSRPFDDRNPPPAASAEPDPPRFSPSHLPPGFFLFLPLFFPAFSPRLRTAAKPTIPSVKRAQQQLQLLSPALSLSLSLALLILELAHCPLIPSLVAPGYRSHQVAVRIFPSISAFRTRSPQLLYNLIILALTLLLFDLCNRRDKILYLRFLNAKEKIFATTSGQ